MKHRAEPKLNIYFVSHGDGLVQDEGEMMVDNPISKKHRRRMMLGTPLIPL